MVVSKFNSVRGKGSVKGGDGGGNSGRGNQRGV
jgi:hypothetical protein